MVSSCSFIQVDPRSSPQEKKVVWEGSSSRNNRLYGVLDKGHASHGEDQADDLFPRLFPFQVSAASLALLFLIMMLVSIQQRQLTPGFVIIGTFILFTLWLTGLIEIGITLYGPKGSVNSLCNAYQSSKGVSQATLAYLETNTICECTSARAKTCHALRVYVLILES